MAGGTIATNQAIGGPGLFASYYPGGNGGSAMGGGLFATGGSLQISASTVVDNRAAGGPGGYAHGYSYTGTSIGGVFPGFGGSGGSAQGGGLYVNGALLSISSSSVASNQVIGGNGGDGYGCNSYLCRYIFDGEGGAGGLSQGGGLYLGSGALTLIESTISGNTLRAGIGGNYVPGDGYGVGGNGGTSQGGGLYVSGTLTASNSTIAANTARGGDAGQSTDVYRALGGAGQGAGLWVAAGAMGHVSFSTIAANQAAGGSGQFNGSATGGGVNNQGTLQTRDCLLAGNTVAGPGTNGGADVAGDLGSLGHNLIGTSNGGSGYDATDLLDVDPLLGPLADNGGPTQTMALLPGSPAIDAGDNTDASMWDQRGEGYPRIVNGIIDIGAFEVQAPAASRPTGQPLPDPLPVPSSPASNALGPESSISMDLPQGPAESPGATDRVLPASERSAGARAAPRDLFLAPVPENADRQRAMAGPDLESVWSARPPPPVSLEVAGLV